MMLNYFDLQYMIDFLWAIMPDLMKLIIAIYDFILFVLKNGYFISTSKLKIRKNKILVESSYTKNHDYVQTTYIC